MLILTCLNVETSCTSFSAITSCTLFSVETMQKNNIRTLLNNISSTLHFSPITTLNFTKIIQKYYFCDMFWNNIVSRMFQHFFVFFQHWNRINNTSLVAWLFKRVFNVCREFCNGKLGNCKVQKLKWCLKGFFTTKFQIENWKFVSTLHNIHFTNNTSWTYMVKYKWAIGYLGY